MVINWANSSAASIGLSLLIDWQVVTGGVLGTTGAAQAHLLGLYEPVLRTSGLHQATYRAEGEYEGTIRRKGMDE